MATIRISICIICLAFICSDWMFSSDMLATKMANGSHLSDKEFATRLIQLAEAELWVREKTGNNDGKRVEEYLATVGLKKGNPYCAAFVSFIFKQAGYQLPRTGWSPSLFPTSRLVKAAAPGNVFGIFFPGIKRIGHCGFVTGIHNDWVNTIEANTNAAGSREGDGVFRRLRHKRALAALADWLRVGTEKKGRKP